MHRVALHFRRVKYNVFLIHKILSKLGHQRCYIMTINIKIKLTDVFSGANTRTLNINHIYSDKIFKINKTVNIFSDLYSSIPKYTSSIQSYCSL